MHMAVASLSPGEGNAAAATAADGGGGGGDEAPLVAVDVTGADGVPAIALAGGNGVPPAGCVPPPVAAGAENGKAPVVNGVPQAIAVDGSDEAGEAAEGLGEGGTPAVEEGLRAVAVEGSGVAAGEDAEEGVKWLKHYSSAQSILLVGDGDFSFSLALASAFGSGENLVATSLDAYATLKNKYNKVESNIMELKRMGATVLHGVDAKTMKLHTDLRTRRFDRIIFNFPHAGFKGKEDHVHMINMHKGLVRSFFYNSSHLLQPYGEIHVSHKIGLPYDIWDIKQLASESFLILVEKVGFQKEDYPGYNQKRGDGAKCDQPFILGACCTFKFRIGDIKKLNRMHRNMICSTSSLRGSNIHPDTTDRGAFHLFPPAWSPPRSAQPVHIGAIQPMSSIPEPLLNGLPTPAGIPPPMSRITSTAHQQQLWYPQRPMFEPLGRSDYPYLAREYQMSLRREYKMRMEVMPVGTCSDYSAFLDHRLRESVQKQEWLRALIALHGRQ